MRQWEESELPPLQFWSSTPRQIAASFEARQAVLIRHQNDRAWLAWHVGALSRPMKKFPSLESMRIKSPGRPRQTMEQQLAIARMMSARGLGKIGRKAN